MHFLWLCQGCWKHRGVARNSYWRCMLGHKVLVPVFLWTLKYGCCWCCNLCIRVKTAEIALFFVAGWWPDPVRGTGGWGALVAGRSYIVAKYSPTNARKCVTIQKAQDTVLETTRMDAQSVMSDSFQLYGLYPTRILCPWNFPLKNSRVGCPFLLQGVFPTQGSNQQLLHRQADSSLLSHREVR